MEKMVEVERATQEELQQDLKSLFQGAIRGCSEDYCGLERTPLPRSHASRTEGGRQGSLTEASRSFLSLLHTTRDLTVPYVPITIAVDEHGVIRQINPPRGDVDLLERTFLSQTFDPPTPSTGAPVAPDLNALRPPTRSADATAWTQYGDALAVWGAAARRDDAISAYAAAVRSDAEDGMAWFRLGVAYQCARTCVDVLEVAVVAFGPDL